MDRLHRWVTGSGRPFGGGGGSWPYRLRPTSILAIMGSKDVYAVFVPAGIDRVRAGKQDSVCKVGYTENLVGSAHGIWLRGLPTGGGHTVRTLR